MVFCKDLVTKTQEVAVHYFCTCPVLWQPNLHLIIFLTPPPPSAFLLLLGLSMALRYYTTPTKKAWVFAYKNSDMSNSEVAEKLGMDRSIMSWLYNQLCKAADFYYTKP